ncbi:hypothetical protein AB0M64_25345 [Streptomyces sp. NPDC051771]|uniref:hypothetical protein n=1 Tax=Streptomyces sp. NPDC051771 TaxID=3154847 RepID=UPI0034483001
MTVPGRYTRHEPPKAGASVDVSYASGDARPDPPVLEGGRRWGASALTCEVTCEVRRFTPSAHPPALGVLLRPLLLPPTAPGWKAAGPAARPPSRPA